MRVIAYTYDADVHCPRCAYDRFGGVNGRRLFPSAEFSDAFDENLVPYRATDREGNPIRPVFSTDEHDFTHCGTCGAAL